MDISFGAYALHMSSVVAVGYGVCTSFCFVVLCAYLADVKNRF